MKHLERAHSDVLKGEDGQDKAAVIDIIEGMNRILCCECQRVKAKSYENGMCSSCWKLSLPDSYPSNVCENIEPSEQDEILEKIRMASTITMDVVKCIPWSLRQWWSKAVTVTLLDWLKASTAKEALQAVERWCKIKAVIVKPLRGGRKKKNKAALYKWQQNLMRWINGDWENVWSEACDLEKRRAKSRKRQKNKKLTPQLPHEAQMKKWIRIKRLVNDGELSKAARDIDGAGVATPTKEIVDELRAKYPKRKE